MVNSPTLALLALFGIVLSFSPEARQTTSKCSSGVHIIVARASGEQQGEGIIGQVSTNIKNQIPNSDSVAVVYPATLDNYVSSESNGTTAMTQLVKSYVSSCPKSKLVLLGYSQGAQVTLDTLCGTSENGFPATSGLGTAYSTNIVAAIAMGDPSHVVSQPYDVGTSKNNGYFPRQSPGCSPYASRIQSYCDFNDTYCDSGKSIQVHVGYVKEYGTAATNFVVNKYKTS